MVVSLLWGLFWGLFYCNQQIKSSSISCFPIMGVILKKLFTLRQMYRLFPRYGGYSHLYGINFHQNQLFPRYGGYSKFTKIAYHLCVSCFPVMGVIPKNLFTCADTKRLFPPVMGVILHIQNKYFTKMSCFPVMGVILFAFSIRINCNWLFPCQGGLFLLVKCCIKFFQPFPHYRRYSYGD